MPKLEKYSAASERKNLQLPSLANKLQVRDGDETVSVYKFSPVYFALNLFLVCTCVTALAWVFWKISYITFILWCVFGLLAFYFLILDEMLVITLSAEEMKVYRQGRLRQRFILRNYESVEYSVKKSIIQGRLRLMLGNEEVDCSALKPADFYALRDELIRRIQYR